MYEIYEGSGHSETAARVSLVILDCCVSRTIDEVRFITPSSRPASKTSHAAMFKSRISRLELGHRLY